MKNVVKYLKFAIKFGSYIIVAFDILSYAVKKIEPLTNQEMDVVQEFDTLQKDNAKTETNESN